MAHPSSNDRVHNIHEGTRHMEAAQPHSAHQGPRLPPLEGLLAGAPSSPGYPHTQIYHHQSPPHQAARPYASYHDPSMTNSNAAITSPTYGRAEQDRSRVGHPFPEPRRPFSNSVVAPLDRPAHLQDTEPSLAPYSHARNQPPDVAQGRYDSGSAHNPNPRPSRHTAWPQDDRSSKGQTVALAVTGATIPVLSEIPNLLGADRARAVEGIKFQIVMRQQPKAARACGSGERDRRNIDPPPIIQLRVEAPSMTREEIEKYIRYESYVMSCAIFDETGTHDASQMPAEYRHQRRLTGSLVGTPFYGKDDKGDYGCFFPFSDLSVRTLGRYRLKFSLIMIDPTRAGQCKHFPILAEVFSAPFDVYTAKEFPGINESTKLVRTLREQGCIIAIKKGNDRKKRAREGDMSEDDDNADGGRRARA